MQTVNKTTGKYIGTGIKGNAGRTAKGQSA